METIRITEQEKQEALEAFDVWYQWACNNIGASVKNSWLAAWEARGRASTPAAQPSDAETHLKICDSIDKMLDQAGYAADSAARHQLSILRSLLNQGT